MDKVNLFNIQENISLQMVTFTLVISEMEIVKVSVHTHGQTQVITKENGLMTK